MKTNSQAMNPIPRNFIYQELPVRVVTIDGEPWFVGKDVCDVLEIQDARNSINLLDEDDRHTMPVIDAIGRKQSTFIVSEAGLYSLILRSRKTEAKLFKRWITHEVLPSIRKTGQYSELSTPDMLVLALQSQKEYNELRARLDILAPKGEYYDRVIDSPSSFSLGETAKMLGYCRYGQNNLIKFLRYEGILMANNVAKQRYIDRGYFELVQREYATLDGSPRFYPVTRVLEKGIDFILRRIKARAARLALEMPVLLDTTPEARENYRTALTMNDNRRSETGVKREGIHENLYRPGA